MFFSTAVILRPELITLVQASQDLTCMSTLEINGTIFCFLIRKKSNGNSTLQYKLKRYCNALYPQKFQVGNDFETEETVGQVVNSSPHRDEFTKEFGIDAVDQVPNIVPFTLPTSQLGPQKAAKKAMLLEIDASVRAVDVVNFSGC